MSHATNVVAKAIQNAKLIMPRFWQDSLVSVLREGTGQYRQFSTMEELEDALLKAPWREVKLGEKRETTRCFKAYLPGFSPFLDLKKSQTKVLKNTKGKKFEFLPLFNLCKCESDGRSYVEISSTELDPFDLLQAETYIFVGQRRDGPVCFSFQPGQVEWLSKIYKYELKPGPITLQEALDLNLTNAKVIY